MRTIPLAILAWVAFAWVEASAANEDSGPKTGYFEVKTTLTEMVGEAAARSFSESLAPGATISWQLYVPPKYSAENPPGILVFISSSRRGGPPRAWNDTLEAHNLIWIGANNAGGTAPVMERIVTAIIAPLVLKGEYLVDFNRSYIAGYADGGQVASMVMMSKPEQFRGGIYLGAAEAWDGEAPLKVDLIRENRHAFLIGANDDGIKDMLRTYNRYKKAGVEHAQLIRMRNNHNSWPAAEFLGRAIDYLDDRGEAAVSSD